MAVQRDSGTEAAPRAQVNASMGSEDDEFSGGLSILNDSHVLAFARDSDDVPAAGAHDALTAPSAAMVADDVSEWPPPFSSASMSPPWFPLPSSTAATDFHIATESS